MKEANKLSKFLDAIQHDAERRQEKIKKETEAFKKEEVKKIKHKALTEAGTIIRKKEEETKTEMNKRVTSHKTENRNRLIMRRNELTDELFTAVSDELVKFTQTDEYIDKLKRDIDSVKDRLSGKITVKHKSNDIGIEKCKGLFPKNTDFVIDNDIKLGGIIIILQDSRRLMNFTFDTAISEEMDRFRSENKLKISADI